MEKTFTFKITESQARQLEELIDKFIKMSERSEKESAERRVRMDQMQKEKDILFAEMRRDMDELSKRTAKWKNEFIEFERLNKDDDEKN